MYFNYPELKNTGVYEAFGAFLFGFNVIEQSFIDALEKFNQIYNDPNIKSYIIEVKTRKNFTNIQEVTKLEKSKELNFINFTLFKPFIKSCGEVRNYIMHIGGKLIASSPKLPGILQGLSIASFNLDIISEDEKNDISTMQSIKDLLLFEDDLGKFIYRRIFSYIERYIQDINREAYAYKFTSKI